MVLGVIFRFSREMAGRRKTEYVSSKVRREQKTKTLKLRFSWIEKNGSVGSASKGKTKSDKILGIWLPNKDIHLAFFAFSLFCDFTPA